MRSLERVKTRLTTLAPRSRPYRSMRTALTTVSKMGVLLEKKLENIKSMIPVTLTTKLDPYFRAPKALMPCSPQMQSRTVHQ